MNPIGIFEAKTKLSEVVAAAQRGEETIILRHGKPVAKIVPVEPDEARRERAREAFERLAALGKEFVARNGSPLSREELLAGVHEGRRWED